MTIAPERGEFEEQFGPLSTGPTITSGVAAPTRNEPVGSLFLYHATGGAPFYKAVAGAGSGNWTQVVAGGGAASSLNVFNVLDAPYSAPTDGVADATAAIQAALDDAATTGGIVYLPTPLDPLLGSHDKPYLFSNLLMSARTMLAGPGLAQVILRRIPGSTGTAIREKNDAGEGNTSGATGIWVRDMWIDCNTCAGDGLNLGNAGANPLNQYSGVFNVFVQNASTGSGIALKQNAAQCGYLGADHCSVGFNFSGGGSCLYTGLWSAGNTSYSLIADGDVDTYTHCHFETRSVMTDPVIDIRGSRNSFFGLIVSLDHDAAHIVNVASGATRTVIMGYDLSDNAHSYTSDINVVSQTKTLKQKRIPLWIDDGGGFPSVYYNQTTNRTTSVGGAGVTPPPVKAMTYSASITPNMADSAVQRLTVTDGNAFAINAPSNPSSATTVVFDIQNSSGGAMGTITWNAVFKLAGGFTNPASTKRRTITFYYDGSAWVEASRAAADI